MGSDSPHSSHSRFTGSDSLDLVPLSMPFDPLVLAGIINTVREVLLILDRQNRVVAASSSYYRSFQESPESTLGRSLWEIGDQMWKADPLEKLLRVVATEDSVVENFEVCHTFVGAGERILVLNARRIAASSRDESLTLLAIEDVTERRLAEQRVARLNHELTLQNAQLIEANRELESFSYSVSHDLRAPLRSIDGFSLAILEDFGSELNGQALQYLDRVRKATQTMGRLIDDLLQLSRLSRSDIALRSVNLSTMARDILEQLREQNPDRTIEMRIHSDLSAMCDRRMIHIALLNLLSNAVKFTSHRTDAKIEFGRTEVDGGRPYFVSDNGAGFDMAYADKLFVPFQRLHSAHEFPGSGVGLAIVQRVIRRHAGRVWAQGRPGEGATVYFTLSESQA